MLEARKLVGSGLNPVVKVACGKDIQQTSTQKGTNNPSFDEVSGLPRIPVLVCELIQTLLCMSDFLPSLEVGHHKLFCLTNNINMTEVLP